jgi:pyridoxal phosphate enzyme (YggS family)
MSCSVIIDNLRQIRSRMYAAAKRAGRNPDEITLCAVTKYAPLEAVKELLASGEIKEAAESRVQDAQKRFSELGAPADQVRWRLIGHLQTNKAKQAVELFDAVDSVGSVHLAQALEKRCAAAGKTLPVLLQVKLTEKETQGGCAPEEIPALLAEVERLPHLKVEGLMGIAPEEEEKIRPAFRTAKGLFDRFFASRTGATLSLGMSHDFETAIEEGSTMVRIGSSLFSTGPQQCIGEHSDKGGQ